MELVRPALVVVDMQNDFCHPEGVFSRIGNGIKDVDQVVASNNELIDAFHAAKQPVFVINTHHSDWTNTPAWVGASRNDRDGSLEWEPLCVEGTWGAQSYGIKSTGDERVLIKHRYTAFFGTSLDLSLRALDRRTVVVTGVATNVCVEATVRDACVRDYQAVVPHEAAGASTEDQHEQSLANMARHFATVTDTASVIAALQ